MCIRGLGVLVGVVSGLILSFVLSAAGTRGWGTENGQEPVKLTGEAIGLVCRCHGWHDLGASSVPSTPELRPSGALVVLQ